MTRKPLRIAVTVSALLHLIVFAFWWHGQDMVVVSSLTNGSPLNISIKQSAATTKPKTPVSDNINQATAEKSIQQNISIAKAGRVKRKSLETASATQAAKAKTTELSKTDSKREQATTNQAQEYALLNNHMIDYLSSEFKLRFKYPMLARKRGWQGEVVLALDINPHGKIAQIAIQRSSGYKVLDRNAVKTFERIGELSPELRTTLAKEHHLSIPVVYKLTGS